MVVGGETVRRVRRATRVWIQYMIEKFKTGKQQRIIVKLSFDERLQCRSGAR